MKISLTNSVIYMYGNQLWIRCLLALYQIVEVNVRVEESGEDNAHNNVFYTEETLLQTESQAMPDSNQLSARHWMIRITRTSNRTGQLTGYKLVPGSNCLPLAGSEAKFLRRAEFLKHNLWATPYALDENFPRGKFLNQNPHVGEGWPRGSNKIVLLKKVISFYGKSSASLMFQR